MNSFDLFIDQDFLRKYLEQKIIKEFFQDINLQDEVNDSVPDLQHIGSENIKK